MNNAESKSLNSCRKIYAAPATSLGTMQGQDSILNTPIISSSSVKREKPKYPHSSNMEGKNMDHQVMS